MAKRSAGLLMFRGQGSDLQVFLVHPGGPFWQKKDLGAWMLPKGEYGDREDPWTAAKREFEEETGTRPAGEFIPLGEVQQTGGKTVVAWAFEGDLDPAKLKSNSFRMEWPPKSGQTREFPEVDRGEWFPLPAARQKILPSQLPFLDRLQKMISATSAPLR